MEYVAIDFETANSEMDSACSVGLVKFDGEGRVLSSYYTLIRPPVFFFQPVNIAVHGIQPSQCRWEKQYDELHEEIMDFVNGLPLVAHNAHFDMTVLQNTAVAYGITLPSIEYYCTLVISRKLLSQFRSHSLGTLVKEYLNEEYDAHMALSDALECGRLFARMLGDRLHDKASLDHYLSLNGINCPRTLSSSDQSVWQ